MWGVGSKGSECVAAPSLFASSFHRSLFAPAVASCDFTLSLFDWVLKKTKRRAAEQRGGTPREADNAVSFSVMARESAVLMRRKRQREAREG